MLWFDGWWLGYEVGAVPMLLDSSCVAHLLERFKLLHLIAQHSVDPTLEGWRVCAAVCAAMEGG